MDNHQTVAVRDLLRVINPQFIAWLIGGTVTLIAFVAGAAYKAADWSLQVSYVEEVSTLKRDLDQAKNNLQMVNEAATDLARLNLLKQQWQGLSRDAARSKKVSQEFQGLFRSLRDRGVVVGERLEDQKKTRIFVIGNDKRQEFLEVVDDFLPPNS